jgi:pimeloyl-ACP methyl ester carboxylesterase
MVSPDGVHRIHHAESGTRITTDNLKGFTGGDYNDLGQAATRFAHERMRTELAMRWVPLPGLAAVGNAVLASPDLAVNEETLLVLMPGSGSVRAGTWGRTLLITDSLEHGSMIEWLREAAARKWAVVSFDPNPNNGGELSGTPCCVRSWQSFVAASPAKRVLVVAHSAGGAWLCACLAQTPTERLSRIKAIALTDTFQDPTKLDAARTQLLRSHGRHWRTGTEPLDVPIEDERGGGCETFSAGTTDHASTNFCAKDSIFTFFDDRCVRS